MSEEIPNNKVVAPPPMAMYPRAQSSYGSSMQLDSLYRGYHGLSYTFLFMFLTYVLFIVVLITSNKEIGASSAIAGIACLASFVGIFYFAIRSGKDIGYGCNWNTGTGIALGVLAPFVGIIMIVVLQYLALAEMKHYGIRSRAFRGISRKEVRGKIEELRSKEQSSSVIPTA